MQVIVKSRHTRVPASLKAQAVEKIERVRRFFDRIIKLEIEFSEEHNPRINKKHAVEVTLSTKNHVLRAVGTGVDPVSAIDAVVDKLEAQVKRMKDKVTKRGRSSSKKETIRIPATTPAKRAAASKNGSAGGKKIESSLRVRRTGRFSVAPMTPKQAAAAMDSAGEEFLPFMNAETEQVSVVYRMADGSFGLVEPE